jgi:perosamine synthetase
MAKMFVPVSRPLLGKEEEKFVTRAIKRGEISGLFGDYINQFESSFAKFVGVKHALTVNSGTTAIHLAVAALDIGPGDDVLVSTFTNMATFFAVIYQGAKPIPVDSENRTLNMDPKDLEKKITKKTKAIIVVHIYGHPADMDPIMRLAKKHKLKVIEDAAEAHGATYKGKMVGSIGDIGCFSFYSNKIVTTGEGGGVTTNNDKLAERMRNIKNLAFGDKDKFMHKELGFKYQMTNLQAAVGAAQMTKIDKIIKTKREIGAHYLKGLAGVEGIQLPIEETWAKNVYWMFNILLRGKLSGKRREFMAKLKDRGVDTREDFVPFNQQIFFLKEGMTKKSDCPTVNTFYDDGLYLPSGTDISKKEMDYVIEQVKAVVAEMTQ